MWLHPGQHGNVISERWKGLHSLRFLLHRVIIFPFNKWNNNSQTVVCVDLGCHCLTNWFGDLKQLIMTYSQRLHTIPCHLNVWTTDKPAEKGRKASLFLNLPSWSRKCCGLKECGVSHIDSSCRTEFSVGIIMVPWGNTNNENGWYR